MHSTIKLEIGRETGRALIVNEIRLPAEKMEVAFNLKSGEVFIGVNLCEGTLKAIPQNAHVALCYTDDPKCTVALVPQANVPQSPTHLILITKTHQDRLKLTEYLQSCVNHLHKSFPES